MNATLSGVDEPNLLCACSCISTVFVWQRVDLSDRSHWGHRVRRGAAGLCRGPPEGSVHTAAAGQPASATQPGHQALQSQPAAASAQQTQGMEQCA